MKKLLLFVLLMSFLAVNAQQPDGKKIRAMSPHYPAANYCDDAAFTTTLTPGLPAPQTFTQLKDQRDTIPVNPIAIGQAGNAFGFAFMRTTYLWVDNNINSVAFMHRMDANPGTGYLAYDISKNGGLDWTNNVQTYNPTNPGGFNARYPQGAIYNPAGNTDPDNAYFHYFAPTLDGSNSSGTLTWGGYAYGVKNLGQGSTPTQHDRPSSGNFYQFLPSGFTITQTGDAWMVDTDELGNGDQTYTYTGSLIVGHGIWNPDLPDYEYTFEQWPLEIIADGGINDVKIAFAPDGLTGYICVMTELPDPLPYSSYHPVLIKTSDGGETWEDPFEVQLGGEDGLPAVQQFIADSMLVWYYDQLGQEVPPRDEIPYWMGYECDLSVDAWGNPHLIGLITLANLETGEIITNEGVIGMFHVWSDDQGQTWDAFNLSYIHQFSATFGVAPNQITMYNRPQVATTQDGAIVFFSWIDTENPDLTDNSQPDIFFREYLPTLNMHGDEAENVTFFSAGMWSAYYGCMSHYVFTEVTESDLTYTCTIPFVYQQMGAGNDPLLPVQFWYIPDFVKTYTITGIGDKEAGFAGKVSQNYPNPFSQTSVIKVDLTEKASLKLVVTNLLGQRVLQIERGDVPAGTYQFDIDGSKLGNGVYFYTVFTGKESVSRKMVVN